MVVCHPSAITRTRFTREHSVGVSDPIHCALTHAKAEKVKERNEAYYAKFPEDAYRIKKIIEYLTETPVSVPSGKLTPARFQQLGILFGFHGKKSLPSIFLSKLHWY